MLAVFLSVLLLAAALSILAVSASNSRWWFISPAVLAVAYFCLVILPGILVHDNVVAVNRSLIAYVCWFLGSLLGLLFMPGAHARTSAPRGPTYQLEGRERRALILLAALAIPSVILTFYVYGRIPLFVGLGSLFGGDSELSMHAARRMNTLEHRYGNTVYFGQGYLKQIYSVISPVSVMAIYLHYRLVLIRSSPVLLRAVMLFLIVAASLNGQIWPAVNLLIFFILGWMFVQLTIGRRVSANVVRKGLITYAGLIAFVFGYRYLQYIEGRLASDFVLSTLRRIFSPAGVDLFYLFPDSYAYRYGQTWLNDLMGFLPGSSQNFSYEVHYLVHGGGWGFTLSPGVVASSYVNFGYGGAFAVGLLATSVFTFLFRKLLVSKSLAGVSVGLYLSLSFMLAMPGDIISFASALLTGMAIWFAMKAIAVLMPAPSVSRDPSRGMIV